MKSSTKSLPIKTVKKGDFEIPLFNYDDNSDSMLNCDATRLKRNIHDSFQTNPLLQKTESRFSYLFNNKNNEEQTGTDNIVNNLKVNRHYSKIRTLNDVYYLDPDLDISETSLMKQIKLSSKNEISQIIIEEPQLNSGKSSLITILEGEDDGNDVNERKESVFPYMLNDYKKNLNEIIMTEKKSNTSIIPSKTNENLLISLDNLPNINLDSFMISNMTTGNGVPIGNSNSNLNNTKEIDTNHINNITETRLSFESLVKIMYNPYLQKSFLKGITKESDETILSLIEVIRINQKQVLLFDQSLDFLYEVYSVLLLIDKSLTVTFLNALDYYKYACSSEGVVLLSLLHRIKEVNKDDIEYVFSLFNSRSQWETLIFNKNGKNFIEFFLKANFSKQNISEVVDNIKKSNENDINDDKIIWIQIIKQNDLERLFNFLNDSFVIYSKMNYSTFVIQVYVEYYHTNKAYHIIKSNILELSSCRNGIFVILSSIKGYKSTYLNEILYTLLSYMEILCNDIYASTLMENVIKMHSDLALEYLIKYKLDYLLSIIENQYGNFIIQKMVIDLRPSQSKTLLIKHIQSIIPYIKKSNIKNKWYNLIVNAEKNDDIHRISSHYPKKNKTFNKELSNNNKSLYSMVLTTSDDDHIHNNHYKKGRVNYNTHYNQMVHHDNNSNSLLFNHQSCQSYQSIPNWNAYNYNYNNYYNYSRDYDCNYDYDYRISNINNKNQMNNNKNMTYMTNNNTSMTPSNSILHKNTSKSKGLYE